MHSLFRMVDFIFVHNTVDASTCSNIFGELNPEELNLGLSKGSNGIDLKQDGDGPHTLVLLDS